MGNTLKGPHYASVDLRVAREFGIGGNVRAELSLDVFNVLNRVNVKDLYTNYGGIDPKYGFQAFRIVHGVNVGVGFFF